MQVWPEAQRKGKVTYTVMFLCSCQKSSLPLLRWTKSSAAHLLRAGWPGSSGSGSTPGLGRLGIQRQCWPCVSLGERAPPLPGHLRPRHHGYCTPASTVPAPAGPPRGWLRPSGQSTQSAGPFSGLFSKQVCSGGCQRPIRGSAPRLPGSDLLILLLPGPWPADQATGTARESVSALTRGPHQGDGGPKPCAFRRVSLSGDSQGRPEGLGAATTHLRFVNRAQAPPLCQPTEELPCGHTGEPRERRRWPSGAGAARGESWLCSFRCSTEGRRAWRASSRAGPGEAHVAMGSPGLVEGPSASGSIQKCTGAADGEVCGSPLQVSRAGSRPEASAVRFCHRHLPSKRVFYH